MSERTIEIDGETFRWRVVPADAQWVTIRIWRPAEGTRRALLEVAFRFDDPWLNYGPMLTAPASKLDEVFQRAPVTPKLVRQVIERYLGLAESERGEERPWRCEWRDGELREQQKE